MGDEVSIEREYEVHTPRSQSYRVTLPKRFFDEFDIEEGSNLGIELTISNGVGCIDYIYPAPPHLDNRKLTEGRHTIRIPTSIGDSMQIAAYENINWSAVHEGSQTRFRAQTKYRPLNITAGQWSELKSLTMMPRTASDSESPREHFDVYFNEREREMLGWEKEMSIGFMLVSHDGKPALRLQPMTEDAAIRLTNVNKSGFKTNDARVYIPKALVRGLSMAEKEIKVLYRDNSAVLTRV